MAVPTQREQLDAAAAAIRARCGDAPATAVVLGSGLGDFADTLTDAVVVPYGEIPHWPQSTVVGHAGKMVVGKVRGHRVVALAGRSHFYEGHPMSTVVFGTRVLARLGVRHLVLTNAAGGINTGFAQGALMVIDDHINLMGTNPLVGANDEALGPRFPDMSEVYSKRLRGLAATVAAEQGRKRAVATYSGFKVGAALETADGTVITGCNVENATYGLTVCAERVAMLKALSEGHRRFTRIAVVADTEAPTPPCGPCRQILWEFAGDIEVVMANTTRETARLQLADLFPLPFEGRLLR